MKYYIAMKKIILQKEKATSRLSRSYWMLSANTFAPTCSALLSENCSMPADIAIIGGGFVGLWTAIFTKQKRPEARVVILERDMCGGGASGRNGGMAMSWWPEISTLVELFGEKQALELADDSERAISELGEFCERYKIDAHFNQKGWLWTATTEAQLNSWSSTIKCTEKLGVSPYQELSAAEVSKRTGSDRHLAGIFEKSNATVQPALLVAGLKRVALELGVEIYENTSVSSIEKTQPALIKTQYAELKAHKVVLATNAWAAIMPELKKYVIPVSSSVIVTKSEPDIIAKRGWAGGECVTDSQAMIGYYHVTKDGRVSFGKGVGDLTFKSQITNLFSSDAKAAELTTSDFRRYYPMLNNVGVEYAWTGPVDYTRNLLPMFGNINDAPHIIYGIGWSGNGVSPSQIGGKILSSMALDISDKWSSYPLVGLIQRGGSPKLPPEPFRYLGGKAIRMAVYHKELREANNQKVPWWMRRMADLAEGIGT